MASTSNNNESKLELELEYQLEEEEKDEASSVEKDDKRSDESSPNQDMTTSSQHYFGIIGDGFSISIIENMKEEYGLFVWPSSVILAEYVWQSKSRFSGANVVELGAGTSLPGLVAAKVGADVTLTDDSNRLEVLDNMRRVCKINDLKCRHKPYCCRYWDSTGVYEMLRSSVCAQMSFSGLMCSTTRVQCPDSVFITTYYNRSGHHLIEFLMDKWCLKCTKLLDGFSFMPPHKASRLSGNIQLAEIVLDSSERLL